MTIDELIPPEDIVQKRWEQDLSADRVTLVDAAGHIIDGTHPLATTATLVISGGLALETIIKETPPTDATKNNASAVYTYNADDDLIKIEKTIDGVVYTKNYTYDSNSNLITSSEWL